MLGIALNLCFFCNSRLLLDGMGVFFPFLTFLLCTISLQGGEDPEISWFASIPSALPFIPFKRLFSHRARGIWLSNVLFSLSLLLFIHVKGATRRMELCLHAFSIILHLSLSPVRAYYYYFLFFFYFTEAFSSVDRGTGLRSPLVWRCDQCEWTVRSLGGGGGLWVEYVLGKHPYTHVEYYYYFAVHSLRVSWVWGPRLCMYLP